MWQARARKSGVLASERGAHPILRFKQESVAPRHREQHLSSAGRSRFLNHLREPENKYRAARFAGSEIELN
jgi:hypothetical protein